MSCAKIDGGIIDMITGCYQMRVKRVELWCRKLERKRGLVVQHLINGQKHVRTFLAVVSLLSGQLTDGDN